MDIIKRIFDIFFSFIALIVLVPLFVAVSIFIKMESNGTVFFTQKRIGKNFKPFKLHKFRTMVTVVPERGLSITAGDDPRITNIGKFLRKTKIDEIPQVINVLKGDMSFVGPRPEIPKYVEMFKSEYKEILKVKPGITDFAAIEFRDEEDVLRKYNNPEEGYVKEVLPRKIELYKMYISKMSFLTDLKLIFLTLWKIAKV